MKKHFTSIILLFFISTTIYSQVIEKREYISFSIGAGIPTGVYGSTNINSDGAGDASVGLDFDFTFAFRFGKNLGVAAQFFYQSNYINDQSFINQLNFQYPQISWRINSTPWTTNAYMFGLYGGFPLDPNANTVFELKELIGIANTTSPDISISGSSLGISASANQFSNSASSFAVSLGAGLRFNVGQQISLLLDGSYFSCNPRFNNILATTTAGQSQTASFSQSCTTLNITFGIAYKF